MPGKSVFKGIRNLLETNPDEIQHIKAPSNGVPRRMQNFVGPVAPKGFDSRVDGSNWRSYIWNRMPEEEASDLNSIILGHLECELDDGDLTPSEKNSLSRMLNNAIRMEDNSGAKSSLLYLDNNTRSGYPDSYDYYYDIYRPQKFDTRLGSPQSDRESYLKMRNMRNSIQMDPLLYVDDENPYIRDYARKIINGTK